jgi:hypothetical protein
LEADFNSDDQRQAASLARNEIALAALMEAGVLAGRIKAVLSEGE